MQLIVVGVVVGVEIPNLRMQLLLIELEISEVNLSRNFLRYLLCFEIYFTEIIYEPYQRQTRIASCFGNKKVPY